MRIKSTYLYLLLFAVHVLIAMVAFLRFRLHPFDTMFPDDGDGLKNLYAMVSYVREPITADGIFKYSSFQYPIGEYVYYTDNTPLFSIPYRWFCQHIYDASGSVVVAYYVFVIFNIIAGGLMLFYILRTLIKHDGISFLLATVLPWTNMQLLRIWRGHYNLSFTLCSLTAICLMIAWHKYRERRAKQVLVAAAGCILAFLSFLAHGYYLAIVSIFMSGMVFFYGFAGRKQQWGRFSMVAGVVLAVVSVGFTLLVVYCTDRYLPLRKDHPGGYDWMEQKVRFTALFSGYTFQQFKFPVMSGSLSVEPEQAAYLGNIALFFLLAAVVGMAIDKEVRAVVVAAQRRFFQQPLTAGIMGGALLVLSISFGENYYTSDPRNTGLHFVNILNPFFYLHFITRAVEQFRSLERFVFPFYFVFNIWVGYTIVAVLQSVGKRLKIGLVLMLVVVGGAEMADHVDYMQINTGGENLFADNKVAKVRPIHIDSKKYQAVLPIPYYLKGPDDDDWCIGDNGKWVRQTYQIALGLNLPLMSMYMDRTPPAHGKMMIEMVAYGKIAPRLRQLFNKKPVLVAVNTKLLTDSAQYNIPHDKGIREEHYWSCISFVQRNNLSPIDSMGDIKYYEWAPPSDQ